MKKDITRLFEASSWAKPLVDAWIDFEGDQKQHGEATIAKALMVLHHENPAKALVWEFGNVFVLFEHFDFQLGWFGFTSQLTCQTKSSKMPGRWLGFNTFAMGFSLKLVPTIQTGKWPWVQLKNLIFQTFATRLGTWLLGHRSVTWSFLWLEAVSRWMDSSQRSISGAKRSWLAPTPPACKLGSFVYFLEHLKNYLPEGA